MTLMGVVSGCVLFPQFTGSSNDVMEKWILSRLTSATNDCNKGFAVYEFPDVTTAIYNFWLYELCDVYLVREIKTIFIIAPVPVTTGASEADCVWRRRREKV